jgi:hypothetical protein
MEEWNMSIHHPAKALELWLEMEMDEELAMVLEVVLEQALGVASVL